MFWKNNDDLYVKCDQKIETSIKHTGTYDYKEEDECIKIINNNKLNDKYRKIEILENNNFISGKLMLKNLEEYNECIKEMESKLEKNGINMYRPEMKCHNILLNLDDSKYKIKRIADRIYITSESGGLIEASKYIGYTVRKK